MKGRVYDTNDKCYENYGGRGIEVCAVWQNFEGFLADMGEAPEGLSLDRIDVDGHYCKENCRWATPKEQARNQRKTLYIEYKGTQRGFAELVEELGLDYYRVYRRMKRGMSFEEAVNDCT